MGPALLILCAAVLASFVSFNYVLSGVPEHTSDEELGRGMKFALIAALIIFAVAVLGLGFVAVRAEEYFGHLYSSMLTGLTGT